MTTIERLRHPSYGEFAGRATVANPCHSRPCCSCACTTPAARRWRSGFFPHLAGDNALVWAGGSDHGLESVLVIRDEIERRVRGLLADLSAPLSA
jgi:hypothetical protein